MRSLIIGFAVGVGWLQMQAELPHYAALFSLVVACLLLGALYRCRYCYRSRFHSLSRTLFCSLSRTLFCTTAVFKIPLLALLGAMLGFVWAALFAHVYLAQALPKDMEGVDIAIVGTIDSLPDYFDRGVRFNFAVEKVHAAVGVSASVVPSRLALSWYSGFDPIKDQGFKAVRPGERWQLTVRLRRPHGNANLYGFDYERWLLEQNIRATGYVRPDHQNTLKNERLTPFVPSFRNVVEHARDALRDRVQHALQGKQYAGVITALVIGDQRAVSQSDWNVFNRTGVGHLFSVSGLHITMISGLFARLVFVLWRYSFFTKARLPLLLPAQKAAAVGGALAAIVYVLLAGSGIPAQRTLYMLLVMAFALWSGRITSVSHVLCIALGVVLLLDSWAVLGPGFWLSFVAVAAILYVSVGRAHGIDQASGSKVRAALLTQYAVTIGLVPLSILLFAQTSLVSPIANAIAIPLVSFVVTPLALLGSVLPSPLGTGCLGVAQFLIAQLAQFLEWLSAFPYAVWMAPVPDWWMIGLAVVGTAWMLAPRGWPSRYMGLFAWLPLVLNGATHPPAGEMWVTAFDVGQGTALLIETEHHRLLYDTGPAYSTESDGGNRVILPYLRARGINKLDGIIVTHSDVDHAGGALSIMREIDAGWVSSSLPVAHPIVDKSGARHRRCATGQSWEWDGVTFEMLYPTQDSYSNEKLKPNARSCTLKVTSGKHSILLPGDIEAPQEAGLIHDDAAKLRANVLVAPHHGSGTSSTQAFLEAVAPEIALFQVGYRNRYRHPKQDVVARYDEMDVTSFRTDQSGAVSLRFSETIEVQEYRRQHARYWYGR